MIFTLRANFRAFPMKSVLDNSSSNSRSFQWKLWQSNSCVSSNTEVTGVQSILTLQCT